MLGAPLTTVDAERKVRKEVERQLDDAVRVIDDLAAVMGLPVQAEDRIAEWRRDQVRS